MKNLVVVLAAGLATLLAQRRRWGLVTLGLTAVAVGLLPGLIVLSRRQCLTWRDTVALWRHAVAQTARFQSAASFFSESSRHFFKGSMAASKRPRHLWTNPRLKRTSISNEARRRARLNPVQTVG